MGQTVDLYSRFEVRDLSEKDFAELSAIARDDRIWAFDPAADGVSPSGFAAWVENARCDHIEHGHRIVVIRDTLLNRAVGTSRFIPTRDPKEIEIGATWLGVGWWGSGCHERAKRWMIESALDSAGIERIRFVVDVLNIRATTAIVKIGACHVALLKGDRVCRDGRSRDVNVFVLDRSTWYDDAKSRLMARISEKGDQPTPSALEVAAKEKRYSIVEIPPQATHDIRQDVLRPGQPRERIDYPEDGNSGALHIGVVIRGCIVGVASFYTESAPANEMGEADIRLRGMAVRHDLQQLGIGRALLQSAIERLRATGARGIWCNARTSAASYYAKLGFIQFGEEFSLADIGMHRRMYFDLQGPNMPRPTSTRQGAY